MYVGAPEAAVLERECYAHTVCRVELHAMLPETALSICGIQNFVPPFPALPVRSRIWAPTPTVGRLRMHWVVVIRSNAC
jgi:hypothetical protein